ncbi:MAG: DUF222 domain-containing protein [Actinobacteria bacterium]|nr:DUF222 domain-containing protein [Actinomycetota bacterium]
MSDPRRSVNLEDDEVLDVLRGLQRAQSRLAWAEQQALVRLAGPHQRTEEVLVFDRRVDTERVVEVADEVRDEIAAALHRSPSLVHDQITAARLLNGPLAATSQALEHGQITSAQVRVIVGQAHRLTGAVRCANTDPAADSPAQAVERTRFTRMCAELQDRVLPAALLAQTKALTRRVIAAIDVAGEQRRREQARCTRDVWVSPDEDGLATLVARLDALTAHAIRAAIDTAAHDPAVAGDCAATAGERRAEAFAAIVLGQVQVTAQIDVLVPLAALFGDSDRGSDGTASAPDHHTGASSAALPDGTLVGWESVQALVDDPTVRTQLRRLTIDPRTGTAIDLGRSRYEVSEPLRRWISARDRTCRFPGCRRRATACQVDHIDPWDDGGRTDAANLQALCTRHHQLKTHRGWRVARDPDSGRTHWISPLGRTYLVDPESLIVPTPRSLAAERVGQLVAVNPSGASPPPF